MGIIESNPLIVKMRKPRSEGSHDVRVKRLPDAYHSPVPSFTF